MVHSNIWIYLHFGNYNLSFGKTESQTNFDSDIQIVVAYELCLKIEEYILFI